VTLLAKSHLLTGTRHISFANFEKASRKKRLNRTTACASGGGEKGTAEYRVDSPKVLILVRDGLGLPVTTELPAD